MSMADFRLISLIEAVRSGSFSTAAANLHLTQPAVSQHIASLEESYGVALFTRSGRRTVPTPAGLLLYRHAERIEASYRSMERDMANLPLDVRVYEVGATLTVAEYILPALVGAYQRSRPQTKVRLSVQNTRATVEGVRRNRFALGVVEGPFEEEGLHSRALQSDELIAVTAPSHPLAERRERIPLRELLEADIILREGGSGTREVFERHLAAQGFAPEELEPFMEIGSNNAIKSLLESELGVSVLSRLVVARELAEGRLVQLRLSGPRIRRKLTLVWGDYIDHEFLDDFRGFCEGRLGAPDSVVDTGDITE